jgi:hypothetical protein
MSQVRPLPPHPKFYARLFAFLMGMLQLGAILLPALLDKTIGELR